MDAQKYNDRGNSKYYLCMLFVLILVVAIILIMVFVWKLKISLLNYIKQYLYEN